MKKFIAFMVACFSAIALASCSEKAPSSTPAPTSTKVPLDTESTIDKVSKIEILEAMDYILAGSTPFNGFENYSEEEKDVIATLRLDVHQEATFEGNCLIEKDLKTGEVVTYCGEWLKPEMDENLTPPAFGTLKMVTSKEKVFIAQYSDVKMEDAKAYAIAVRKEGYTVNSQEFDLASIGEDTYSFSGANEAGLSIECLYSQGYLRILLSAEK